MTYPFHGNTERKRDDIEEQEVGGVLGCGLSGKDTSLNGSTVCNSLIGVDALLELLAVEEVTEELLNAGDTGRTTDKDNLVNLALVKARVLQHLLNRLDSAVESLGVDLLETSTGDCGVEVLTVEERVNLDSGLGTGGKSPLGTLASCAETTESTRVVGHVLRAESVRYFCWIFLDAREIRKCSPS